MVCLIHKMDLITNQEGRNKIFREYQDEIHQMGPSIQCYPTSIWDETLFRAWSAIICSLIPNSVKMKNQLKLLCRVCGADEMVLFERATFLVVSKVTLKEQKDIHRMEKISNIVKQFKLKCNP